jgi:5-methyltetrahydropteroyltriglutamate--homocysteine methyltransferase
LDEVHRIYEPGHTALLAEERAKDRGRLADLEDAAIRDVVAKQGAVGLPVVTDGEFRRIMYFNSFFDAVDGIAPSQVKLPFRDDDGNVVEHEGPVAIVGRVGKVDSPAVREIEFTRDLTDLPIKTTFPTASFLVVQALLGPAISGGAYTSVDDAADALVGVLRELVDDAVAAGSTYIQFDVSGYMMLAASPLGEMLKSRGIDVDAALARMQVADAAVVEGLPDHVTTCLHQCRGNYASRYMAPHDHLGELGEAFFALPYDRFTLEWDDYVERGDADYAALERVPRGGATVVLGVVSTRQAKLETYDEIAAKIERAAKHIPLEQLAISPQCGFASALTTGDDDRPDGNLLDEDVQWRKLELLVSSADRIWGS